MAITLPQVFKRAFVPLISIISNKSKFQLTMLKLKWNLLSMFSRESDITKSLDWEKVIKE